MNVKKCNTCGEEKTLDVFDDINGGKSGWCRPCKLKYQRNWYKNNAAKMREKSTKRYAAKKEEIAEKSRSLWNSLSEEEKNIRRRQRRAYKKKNIHCKLIKNCGKRLSRYLKRKTLTTIELLGCSSSKLRQHLESLWTEGMSWDNYGIYGWHIDHKHPISSFDLSCPEQMKLCCHYTNLQPLWAKDNLSKSNKIIYPHPICQNAESGG